MFDVSPKKIEASAKLEVQAFSRFCVLISRAYFSRFVNDTKKTWKKYAKLKGIRIYGSHL